MNSFPNLGTEWRAVGGCSDDQSCLTGILKTRRQLLIRRARVEAESAGHGCLNDASVMSHRPYFKHPDFSPACCNVSPLGYRPAHKVDGETLSSKIERKH